MTSDIHSQKRPKTDSKSAPEIAKRPNPTLESIEMIEDALSEMKDYPTKNKLWKSLPRQIQYKTFNAVLSYLEKSKKILYHDGAIVWTFSNVPEHKQLENPL